MDLSVTSGGLRDLRPLAKLTALTTLNLSRNHISDLTPLAGLSQLHWLELRENEIESLGALSSLWRRRLRSLNLRDNPLPPDHPAREGGRPDDEEP